MSMSDHKHVLEVGIAPARRVEVFTGAGRRRDWSADQKAAIVAESYVGEVSVCEVARRHGLTSSQLFAWRREARKRAAASGVERPALFVPAVVDPAPKPEPAAKRRDRARGREPAVELEIDGVAVRIGAGADATTIMAVISALKASR